MFGIVYEQNESAIICGKLISAVDMLDHFEIVIEYGEYHQNVRKKEMIRTKFIVRNVINDEGNEHNYVQSFRKKLYSGTVNVGDDVLSFVRFGDILHLEGRAFSVKSYGEISFKGDTTKCAILGEVKKIEEKVSKKTGRMYLNIVLFVGMKANTADEVIINFFGDDKVMMALADIKEKDMVCFKSESKPYYSGKSGLTYYEVSDYLIVKKSEMAVETAI